MRSGEPASRKIWEAVQTLLSAMNEIQELVAVRLETKRKVLFMSPPALQFVYAMLVPIAEAADCVRWWLLLIDKLNRMFWVPWGREWRQVGSYIDLTSHSMKGSYELADVLIVLEVLWLENSNLARQLKFKPKINDDHYAVNHLTTSIWFQNMELTLMGSCTWTEKCDLREEATRVDGVSPHSRERNMAISDAKIGKCG